MSRYGVVGGLALLAACAAPPEPPPAETGPQDDTGLPTPPEVPEGSAAPGHD